MEPTVYIFRGAPASGKGTIVPMFCELLPKPVALISQDALRWNFHLVGREVKDISDSEHIFANKNAELLFEQYLKSGAYTIVLEGLFTWDDDHSSQGSAKKLTELAESYGYSVGNIVLKADRTELLRRNAARKYAVPPGEFEKLYSNIYGAIDADETVIDSTHLNPEETLEKLKTHV